MMKKSVLVLLVALIVVIGFVGGVLAQPSVSSVSGNIVHGDSVVVCGSEFGHNGPNIVVFDSFGDGITNQNVDLFADVGDWSGTIDGHPTFSNIAHSGLHGIDVYENNGIDGYKLYKEFPEATEVFISYWLKIPEGTCFPNAATPETLPGGSNWKFSWFYYGEFGFGANGDADMCLPTYIHEDMLIISGNEGGPGYEWSDPHTWPDYHADLNIASWWSWTKWMRLSFWLKATNPVTDNGLYYWQIVVEDTNYDEDSIINNPVFHSSIDLDKRKFDRMTIPGWITPGSSNTNPIYDDIYVAIGSNSAARVELGNAPVYSSCTNLAITTPTYWTDDEISVTIRPSSFQEGDTAYLFVVDGNGTVSEGYPITFGEGDHEADTNDDGFISIGELISFIARWKAGDGVTKEEVEGARNIWFSGGVY